MTPPSGTSLSAPPTDEIGYSGITPPIVTPWAAYSEQLQEDEVPDLRYPGSIPIYHRMRTDSQIDSLLKAVFLPLRRMRWVIDPRGARDEVVDDIATDLGLPIKGVGRPAPRYGRVKFNHDMHLQHALLAPVYGHMFFEQVGIIDADLKWRLRKLAPRMPQSISRIRIAKDGGLDGINQFGNTFTANQSFPGQGLPIDISRLSAYVWEREGANWIGRSIMRPLYRHWVLKDRIMRIDAMRHEKYGLGIPKGKAPKGSSAAVVQEYGAMATGVRANPDQGFGLPDGGDLTVEGFKGSLPDTIQSLKYHDEAMARDFLAMFLQLGTTTSGSRALGGTFVDFFKLSCESIAEWYKDLTNRYVIEDMVDWNYGEDELAPGISWEVAGEDVAPAANDLALLITKGVIVADKGLREWARDHYQLPEADDPDAEPPAPAPAPGALPAPTVTPVPAVAARMTDRLNRQAAARAQTLHSTATRRDRTPTEISASTDFDAIQTAWVTATTGLVAAWAAIRSRQIDSLVNQVKAAADTGNVEALTAIRAASEGTDIIADHMIAVVEEAVTQALAEASDQGVDIPLVNTTELETGIRRKAAAVAALLALSLSQSAATQALMRYGATELTADEVADGVRAHLEALSDSFLNDTLGGALTQAQNLGRFTVFAQRPATYYASELLDTSTCAECAAIDGTSFDSIEEASKVYPTGGYAECEGGDRCRGTIVAVFDESEGTAAA